MTTIDVRGKLKIGVGDVWAVRTGNNWAAKLIRFGELAGGLDFKRNHVVVVHHMDDRGTWWGIEGRPGGVGWVDLTRYVRDPLTVTNAGQPRTASERKAIADTMQALLGTPYDWRGIIADAGRDLRLPNLFAQDWHGKGAPGHVVCSSVAAYVYLRLDLAHPELGHERQCEPGDWADFDEREGWAA